MNKRWIKSLTCIVMALALLSPAGAHGEGPGKPPPAEVKTSSTAAPLAGGKFAKLYPNLAELVAASRPTDRIPVLILLEKGAQPTDLPASAQQAEVRPFRSFPALAGRLTPEEIRVLAAAPSVAHIEWDAPVRASLDTASRYFGITRVREAFALTGDLDGQPDRFTASDVVIAVVDTGIDVGHVDLSGKVIDWHDFVNGRTMPYDDSGHGTHVAGIAAGRGLGSPEYTGVAPGAALVGLKVLDQTGSGTLSAVAAALDWCIQHRQQDGIRIINLSLGSPGPGDGTDVLSQAVNAATAHGLVVVAAAGNEGPGPRSMGAPGVAAGAITVGAMADPGEEGFYLTPFSGRGPTADGRTKPDIIGPGVDVRAPRAGTRDQYTSYSGTSMATPFVSGTAALLLAANPALTPSQVRDLLQSTAQPWGESVPNNDYGWGRLDAYAAVARALGRSTGGGPVVPAHLRLPGALGERQTQEYQLPVADTLAPLAATLIMPQWVSGQDPDFDLVLLDPDGRQVASSIGVQRTETVHASVGRAGTWRLRVVSYRGSGPFWLDVSGDLAADAPPSTAITSPQAGAQLSGDVLLTAVANDDLGIAQLAFAVDEGPYQDITTSYNGRTYQGLVHTADLGDGQHVLRVRALDTSGQPAAAAVSVVVQNGAGWRQQVSRSGTVSPGAPDAWMTLQVGSPGLVDLQLDWAGGADLDLYAYAPDGSYVGRAYTTSNPERLRIDTGRWGSGTYRLKARLYSGAGGPFTLHAQGYARTSFVGSVSPSSPDSLVTLPVFLTGAAALELGWSGSQDLDLYLSDPTGRLRARAYTAANPERLTTTVDRTGNWQARVNLYRGGSLEYTLQVWLPANCLQ